MSLLQLIVIITGFLFFLFAIDLYERKKFHLLHFLVFFGGTGSVVFFVLRPDLLDRFGEAFGIARGADLIVYLAIILLWYLYFEILNKLIKRDIQRTDLARVLALSWAWWSIQEGDIVFLIPSYGEDATVLRTIKNVLDAWYAVVCIDDGENKILLHDELKEFFEQKRCVLLEHPYNMWQGAALQTWTDYVQKYLPFVEYVVHFDADGQHQIDDLAAYLKAFEDNDDLDIVLWSRFLGKAKNISWRRWFHKKMQIWFMRLLVGLKLTDTNNGYRVIKRSALSKLRITLNGMAHASQLESLIKANKLKYQEVPVTILYTEYSVAKGQKLSNAWNIVKKLVYDMFFYK